MQFQFQGNLLSQAKHPSSRSHAPKGPPRTSPPAPRSDAEVQNPKGHRLPGTREGPVPGSGPGCPGRGPGLLPKGGGTSRQPKGASGLPGSGRNFFQSAKRGSGRAADGDGNCRRGDGGEGASRRAETRARPEEPPGGGLQAESTGAPPGLRNWPAEPAGWSRAKAFRPSPRLGAKGGCWSKERQTQKHLMVSRLCRVCRF